MATLVQDGLAKSRFTPARAGWRTLITHAQPEPAAEARIIAAADLAAKLDALLIGVGAEMLEPMGMTDPYGVLAGDFSGALLASLQENLAAAANAFRIRSAGARTQWVALEEVPAAAVCRLSRGADLIVAGGSPLEAHDTYRWCDPAALAIRSGRPVLVVPPDGGALRAEAAVVAWKDAREGRRAVADALPVLKCADRVLVLAAGDKDAVADARGDAEAVVRYLERHGVSARAKSVAATPDEVVGALQSEAQALGADLIICGAYGHSRLGEWVFGGVTRDLLRDPKRFLLMSH